MKTKKATPSVTATPAPVPASVSPTPAPSAKDAANAARLARVITVLAAENPKKPGSKTYARFALYKNGMTTAQALSAGVRPADIAWDVKHKFISLA